MKRMREKDMHQKKKVSLQLLTLRLKWGDLQTTPQKCKERLVPLEQPFSLPLSLISLLCQSEMQLSIQKHTNICAQFQSPVSCRHKRHFKASQTDAQSEDYSKSQIPKIPQVLRLHAYFKVQENSRMHCRDLSSARKKGQIRTNLKHHLSSVLDSFFFFFRICILNKYSKLYRFILNI